MWTVETEFDVVKGLFTVHAESMVKSALKIREMARTDELLAFTELSLLSFEVLTKVLRAQSDGYGAISYWTRRACEANRMFNNRAWLGSLDIVLNMETYRELCFESDALGHALELFVKTLDEHECWEDVGVWDL